MNKIVMPIAIIRAACISACIHHNEMLNAVMAQFFHTVNTKWITWIFGIMSNDINIMNFHYESLQIFILPTKYTNCCCCCIKQKLSIRRAVLFR